MHKLITIILTSLAVTLVPTALMAEPQDDVDQAEPNAADIQKAPANIDHLVKQLSAESYTERETATAKLWTLGAKAMPALKEATTSKDPELADRASELVLYIGAGVLPNSPEEVKKMVITFSKSSTSAKLTILRKLTEMGHWRQVLHLAQMEKDPRARASMDALVKKNASKAARDAVAKGDYDLATEILEMMGDDPSSLVLRAWYYKQRGMLAEQLQKAKSMPGKKASRWRLALHRADQNIPAALAEAKNLGDTALISFLSMLNGDPVPWLEFEPNTARVPSVILGVANRLQTARLTGQKKRADLLARELTGMGRTATTRRQVILILAGNGYRKEALDLLIKHEPLGAFIYYDNMELPALALDALGIPRDASPPYTDWVKKATKNALEEDEESGYLPIFQLAGFFARRGQPEHATATVKPLMDALQEDGSDSWFDHLVFMAQLDMGKQVLTLIEARGNEDGEADLAIKRLLRPLTITEDSTVHLWEKMKKRNNQQLGKALHEMAIFTGLIRDANGEATPLHNALLAEIGQPGPDAPDQTARLRALFHAAEARSDLLTSRDMLARLAKLNPELEDNLARQDIELFRWAKLEPYYAKKFEEDPSSYEDLTKLYIAREKLGKHEDKEAMLEQIMLLSMGEPEALYLIAYHFKTAGMMALATDLWLQTLAVAKPDDKYVDACVQLLLLSPDHLFTTGRWKLVAALAESHIKTQSGGQSSRMSIKFMLDYQFLATFSRGMDLLKKGKRTQAISKLDQAHNLIPGDGSLADYFFPNLLGKGIRKNYDSWFEKSYQQVAKSCAAYPASHNSHNTAAWLASRAVRKLDHAHRHATEALKARPNQGAYVDTMAEVWFARGDRAKAIEWSEKAVRSTLTHLQGTYRDRPDNIRGYHSLLTQLDRFKNAPLPKK